MFSSLFRKRPPVDAQKLLQEAVALHSGGQVDAAAERYRKVLDHDPRNFDALHLLGVVRLQQQEHVESASLIEKALALKPDSPAALSNHALALQALGRSEEALAILDRALAFDGQAVDAWINRGHVLHAMTRYGPAVESFDRALSLRPESAPAYANRGNALLSLGQAEAALKSYDAALNHHPHEAMALANRGHALAALGQTDLALVAFAAAIAAQPASAAAFAGRGIVLANSGRHAEAIGDFNQAIELDPFFVDGLINRGNAFHAVGRNEEALVDFGKALAMAPASPQAHYNRGVVLYAMGRVDEALASYDEAITHRPGFADALFNRGMALAQLRRGVESRASYDAVLAIDPDYPNALGQALNARLELCEWIAYESLRARAEQAIQAGKPISDPFAFLALSDDPRAQLKCARICANSKFSERAPLWNGGRYTHDRIRVAYLSANFTDHPVARLIAELFELHDRSAFELIGISFGPPDAVPMRSRIGSSFDQFYDVRALGDRDAALVLRDRKVDIAVDLMGYTKDARTGILAYRPAPVQVNYLGYPGTLGADFVDYIVADRVLIPPADDVHYAERVVRLPDSYQCNDRQRPRPERALSRADAGLPDAAFVFCCFNNNYKITPTIFDVWMRLLHQIRGSVLWLLPFSATVETNLRREAQARGIDPQRLVFAPRVNQHDHLARHRLADLFLDTLPYNAHTTASDALWAGLPLVTCSGASFESRVAGSLLYAMGAPDLVTHSLADYEALALALASDPSRLRAIRSRLAANRLTAPLFDSVRFCRHMESAYRVMVATHRRGEPPSSFDVAALARPT